MKKHAYLQGLSALHETGLYSSVKGHTAWQDEQSGARDVRRSQVFSQPFTGFGKLQIADRLAFSAASIIFGDLPLSDGTNTGICMGSAFGSLGTDIRYMESVVSGFPRPAWFSATLPSSPVAEVAIQFKLKGPNRVVAGGDCPGLSALDCALSIIGRHKAEGMLVLVTSATDPASTNLIVTANQPGTRIYSYACLITADRLEGGPNWRLCLDGTFCSDNMAPESEESYFLEMVEKMAAQTNHTFKLHTRSFTGNLLIEKDV